MAKPRAVLFDAYGTLFDVYSVGLRAEQLFPGRGARLAVLWRERQIDYSRLITMSGDPAHYRSFWDLTERALRYAIQALVPQAAERWGDYWRFNSLSVRRLFESAFGPRSVDVHGYGNVLTAVAFLHGLAQGDLTRAELDYADRDYELLLTLRAVKRPLA